MKKNTQIETEKEEDIFSTLDSVRWNWRIFAVVIFVSKGEVGNRKYIIHKPLAIYNIFLSIIIIMSSYSLFYSKELDKLVRRLDFDAKLLISIKQAFNFIVLINMTIWKLITINKFRNVIQSFAKQDEVVKEIGSRINYKANLKQMKIFVRLMAITNLLLSFQEVYYGVSLSVLIDWTNWWLPSLIYKSNLSLFFCLIWILGTRFRALNERLILIKKTSTTHPQAALNYENINTLRVIANTHCQLCKIGQKIMTIFIPSLIICAVQTFIFVTMMLYRFIIEIQRNKSLVTIGNNLFGIIITSAQIIIIVLGCNWTKKEATFPEKFIHKLNINQINSRLFEMVQIFSTQMLHQKLVFSVGGLFTLDSALLQTIVGGITTYLVIFLQFGNMENIFSSNQESQGHIYGF